MTEATGERRASDRIRNRWVLGFMALSLVSSGSSLTQCATNKRVDSALDVMHDDITAIRSLQEADMKERADRRKSFDLYREQMDDKWKLRNTEIDLLNRRIDQLTKPLAHGATTKKD